MAHNKLIIRIITCFNIFWSLFDFWLREQNETTKRMTKAKLRREDKLFHSENVSKNLFMMFRFSLVVCSSRSYENTKN